MTAKLVHGKRGLPGHGVAPFNQARTRNCWSRQHTKEGGNAGPLAAGALAAASAGAGAGQVDAAVRLLLQPHAAVIQRTWGLRGGLSGAAGAGSASG